MPLYNFSTHYEGNVAISSHHRISHHNRTFLKIILFTSFVHFEEHVPTLSHQQTSHHKRTFLTIILSTSFAHFKVNLAILSYHRTSHHKTHISYQNFFSSLLLTSTHTLRFHLIIEHHITNEHS